MHSFKEDRTTAQMSDTINSFSLVTGTISLPLNFGLEPRLETGSLILFGAPTEEIQVLRDALEA